MIFNVVYSSNPSHHIISFQFFRYALFVRKFIDKPTFCFASKLINIVKIRVEIAACDKIVISNLAIFLEPPFVPLSPNADRVVLTVSNSQTRNIIITLQFTPKSITFIKNILFHSVILQNNKLYLQFIIPTDYKRQKERLPYEVSPFSSPCFFNLIFFYRADFVSAFLLCRFQFLLCFCFIKLF